MFSVCFQFVFGLFSVYDMPALNVFLMATLVPKGYCPPAHFKHEMRSQLATFCRESLRMMTPVLRKARYDPQKCPKNHCHVNVTKFEDSMWKPQVCWKVFCKSDEPLDKQAILHSVLKHRETGELREITPQKERDFLVVEESRATNDEILDVLNDRKERRCRITAFNRVYSYKKEQEPSVCFFETFGNRE